ncbi:hypothetical protein EDEG_00179 [Edhazardia aedis USNM 41457]|uniref:Eukaryotic translation initiation factor 4E n=1 Tax=Edhazardia aedis (strain USNM 41457) TaxID=1003232 RepID=J9D7D5_EDHAE|nr:hypothetical protein EDEG_00179 [Edhazardia aedis USNM 41457]|eukprot:EJW03691.1 hypothetical protein EDEG_00179 [Edhazardia aedis USNM 41457]
MPSELQTNWTFQYDYQQKGKATQESWKDSLNQIATVGEIESLMYILDNIGEAEEWPFNSNLHFFREDILPMWEDDANVNGGKWVLEFSKEETVDERINDIWKKTVAFCVSEQAPDLLICGCVLSPRKFVDRIAIWTKSKGEEIEQIGRLWKKHVGFDDQIGFKLHENSLKGVRDRNMDIFRV